MPRAPLHRETSQSLTTMSETIAGRPLVVDRGATEMMKGSAPALADEYVEATF
jgi:hypothetical protein